MAQYIVNTIPAPIDFENKDPVTRVLQNIKNVLMARVGEIPYARVIGIDPEIYDLPINRAQDRVEEEVSRTIDFEWRASLVSARAYLDENMQTVIEAVVSIEEEDLANG